MSRQTINDVVYSSMMPWNRAQYKQSLSTTSNMDRQLLRQKSRQKFSVMKTKKLVFPEK